LAVVCATRTSPLSSVQKQMKILLELASITFWVKMTTRLTATGFFKGETYVD
jgi:hypothetical protein